MKKIILFAATIACMASCQNTSKTPAIDLANFDLSVAPNADFYEYAISRKNGCLVCSIYFRNLLKKNGIDFDTFEFTEKEQILIGYGQAIAEDPKHVPEELFAKLKANFTEEEIVVITAMGVMMIANNYFNDILDVTPDKLV